MPLNRHYNKSLHQWVKNKDTMEVNYNERDDTESWAFLISLWRWYPDYLLDLLEDDNADFTLSLIQRVNYRALARYKDVSITGSRGTTKTYVAVGSKLVDGILWPGEEMRYFGPSLKQTSKLAAAAFEQIKKNYPILASYWIPVSIAEDHFIIKTNFGSTLTIATMRGDNAHAVLCEEVGQEEQPKFDHEAFRNIVLPGIRKRHMVNKLPDEKHIDCKKQYITSASTQQNDAYQYRLDTIDEAVNGGSAFAIDYPYQVAVLSGIRTVAWVNDLRKTLTPDEQARELDSHYTGSSSNPVIPDGILTESKKLSVMETHHCGDPEVIYVVAYDVSYEDGQKNAKCATAVYKLTPQKGVLKQGQYLKQLVYVEDRRPEEHMKQAKYLKRKWFDYCMDGGGGTYIVIDGWQYGKSVVEDLMKDLIDGLPPLCCYEHQAYTDLELDGSLPVIYPIKAGGQGVKDPDSDILRYAMLEFEHGNVQILTTDVDKGVEAYKRRNRIKDDSDRARIAIPYIKTKELCGQISNLKREVSGTGEKEKRLSTHINRDMWSATKYGLRFAQILEYKIQRESARKKSSWAQKIEQYNHYVAPEARRLAALQSRVIGYHGGRIK